MKKLAQMKFIIVALVFATVLVGCKPKDQSRVELSDFKEKASITGTLYYDEGQSFDGVEYKRLVKPAANVKVTALVANSEYSTTAKGTGNLLFTTKTDANGAFTLEIPVTNDGVKVKVQTTSFTGQYHRIIDVKDGQPVYSHEEVIYKLDDKDFTLMPNDIEVADGIFTCEERDDAEQFTFYSEYHVAVGKAKYTEEDGDIEKKYEKASNVDVIIEVEHEGEKFKYTSTTDASGIAVFNIPTTVMTWEPTIKVTANPFTVSNFEFKKLEYDGGSTKIETYKLDGYFEQASGFTHSPKFNSVDDMPAPECRVKMNFVPFDPSEDEGYSGDSWAGVNF